MLRDAWRPLFAAKFPAEIQQAGARIPEDEIAINECGKLTTRIDLAECFALVLVFAHVEHDDLAGDI